jgi:hypothetical protein
MDEVVYYNALGQQRSEWMGEYNYKENTNAGVDVGKKKL